MEKLATIEVDLSAYKILLQFHGKKEPLVIHFDTPSRRFYFSIIALIINEMKTQGEIGFIHIHKHKNLLKLLDESLSGKHASKRMDGMWAKIDMAWRHRLPDLETAAFFKVLDRNLISPHEKGGKYRYECSDIECDIWANLFGYDENNKWRFKFAIDSASISLNDIYVTLGDLRDNSAWKEFVKSLSIQPKAVTTDKRAVPRWWKKTAFSLVAVLIVGAATFVIWNVYIHRVSVTKKLELPDKPSIAVLPFENMSEDPKQEYFSDGITEEIISALSSVPKLFVIARNSTFTYKGKPANVQKISKELGVRYVLEGSVKKAGDRIRVTAQLVDAITGNHMWSGRYDNELKELFALQDDITKKIISALQVKLTEGEQARAAAKGTNSLDAYLKYLQAMDYMRNFNRESNALGKQLAEEAIALDPKYAPAYRALSAVHQNDVWLGTSKSPKNSLTKAMELTQKAIALDDTYAEGYSSLGFLYSILGQHDKAVTTAEQGVALNPNSADAHMILGHTLRFACRWEESIPEYKIAIRLNPFPPNNYMFGLGHSYAMTGKYEEAIEWGKKAVRQKPNNFIAHLFLTQIFSLSGRYEEARSQAAEVLRINPRFSVEKWEKKFTYKNQEDKERCLTALRNAGLK